MTGHNHVEHAPVPEICDCNRTPVIGVRSPNCLGDLGELTGTVVDPYALLLIAGETAPLHGGPVHRIGNNRGVAPGEFREIVPVASATIG